MHALHSIIHLGLFIVNPSSLSYHGIEVSIEHFSNLMGHHIVIHFVNFYSLIFGHGLVYQVWDNVLIFGDLGNILIY